MRSIVLALALAFMATSVGAADFDLKALSPAERFAFLRAFPKGGDLHVHLSGAVYPEHFVDWAAEDGWCVDPKALAIVAPPCKAKKGLEPAAKAIADPVLYNLMVDSLTTRKLPFRGRGGHDQFFTTFDRADSARYRDGDMLAEIADRMAKENTFYVEIMRSPRWSQIQALGKKVGWKGGDYSAQAKADQAAGLDAIVGEALADTDADEKRMRDLLHCGKPDAHPGCAVTIRYIAESNRVIPLEQTFAQLQLAAALARRDPRWIAIQLDAPEDDPNALRNYDTHMRIVAFLTDRGRAVNVALHAGEITPAWATPQDLSFHIAEAIHVAGAKRIGHGVDIAHEDDAQGLVQEMASKGVLTEINLTSNEVILDVPSAGAPWAFSTDDPGISRSDLTTEYDRAAANGASYRDLVRSARNAIAYSFLPGKPLWRDPNLYAEPDPACAGELGEATPRAEACARLLDGSEMAREQWRYEHRLRDFERDHAPAR
jgi:adenosine deaminase